MADGGDPQALPDTVADKEKLLISK